MRLLVIHISVLMGLAYLVVYCGAAKKESQKVDQNSDFETFVETWDGLQDHNRSNFVIIDQQL